MQHEIAVAEMGALAEPMAKAVESCVHCGFCLPTCPTYLVVGEEMHSPRGRIVLMKEVLEGTLPLAEATPYLDPCLGCLACVTACPSGVEYGHLITPFRLEMEATRRRSVEDRAVRTLIRETLPYPRRFRVAARAGRLARALGRLVPRRLRAMVDMLPSTVPRAQPLPDIVRAVGPRRARVALLAGCAQQVLAPDINGATIRVLARNGVEVVIPKRQTCCGALAAHSGMKEQAQRFARATLRAFPDDVDAVVTNAAGCGSGMQEYPIWLKGEREEEAAAAFARRVVDVSAFLVDLGLGEPPPAAPPLRIAYHDACHLAHAQGVTSQPRSLLRSIPGVELVELHEPEICCGSAGTYNLEQPVIASELGRRKAGWVVAAAPDIVASGNIGCITQLERHVEVAGANVRVLHTMQVLDRAYDGSLRR
ncbi:MAG: (Fe-S)-binding protein [Trueperaceae bacterium]|nr:(Fe-S)-binding protein [Trueperaceae bacterium]